MAFQIKDDSGDQVITNGTASDVVEFTNTLFYYDMKDCDDESEFIHVEDAVSALKTLSFVIEEN
jgi:hypothetical protein